MSTSSILNCIVTPRQGQLCEEASRTFEDAVSQLTIKEQQVQAIENARHLVHKAFKKQQSDMLARLHSRREQILREMEAADAKIEKKTKKIESLDAEVQDLSVKL